MRFSIRWKLLLFVGLPILIVYVSVLGSSLLHLWRGASANVQREMTELADHYAARFDGRLREIAQIARTTAAFLETSPDLDADFLYAHLRANVGRNELCYGAAIAFAPHAFDPGVRLFSPYVYRHGEELRSMDIAVDGYDYTAPEWEWWNLPRATGRPGWTAPYFDEGAGNILMCTYSAPFFRDGALRGVTTVDLALEALRETVAADFPEDLRFFITTPDGRYVFHSDPDLILDVSIAEQAEEADRDDLRALAASMAAGRSGTVSITDWGRPGRDWIFHAPIESSGWSFAARISEARALADVRGRALWFSWVLALTLLLIIVCVWFVSGRLTRPLRTLRAAAERIAEGDLGAQTIEATSRDEIGDLARTFNTMTADLKTHVELLAQEQAASRDAIIFSMAKLAESRDNETGRHLERICRYVEILARTLQARGATLEDGTAIEDAWIRTVTMTAALHDIGKVGVPDAVLQKPGRLTDDERRIIQKHTTIGGDTLRAFKQQWMPGHTFSEDAEEDEKGVFLRTAAEIAFQHHEKWDGTGYPFGTRGEDITLAARIVAVADVYDALTSERVYKKGMSHEEAKRIILEGAGGHFDPQVVEAFEQCDERFAEVARTLRDTFD